MTWRQAGVDHGMSRGKVLHEEDGKPTLKIQDRRLEDCEMRRHLFGGQEKLYYYTKMGGGSDHLESV